MKKVFSAIILLFSITLRINVSAQSAGKWVWLFNGKSVVNLRGYRMTGFPEAAWKVQNGALVAQPDAANVDLVTKNTYTNFDLRFEWKVSPAGNSGVFYNVEETANHESGNGNSPNWLDNFEMQLLDDIGFNDKEPKRSAGSLYDLIAPQNKNLKPVGQYNTGRLLVNHRHVEQWLNGVKVVQYEIGSPELNRLIAESKYKDNPKFAKSISGHIMFQHHGQKVWLKNIKIKQL